MMVTETALAGAKIIDCQAFSDARGWFAETFSARWFEANVAPVKFVQDNESFSAAGVVRGLHFQRAPHEQAKLVRVVAGRILDVAVDLRPGSPTRGRWIAVELSGENRRQLFIPAGFAHGFSALEESTVAYKVSDFYAPECDGGVRWNDPSLGIDWLVEDPIISAKDAALPNYG